MKLNKYQTPIEELTYTHVDEKTGEQAMYTWDTCPEEVREEFLDYVNTIPFINHLISADRPLCKDLPRDEKGRAIYDITSPPIIENTDYFRPVALHYKKTGRFTDLRPNPAPNSAYKKWLDEEKNRIYNGYLREEDGAWIPGDMYWFLNYTPMIVTRAGENENVGDRVTDAPDFWEGILWRLIGWYDARRVGQNFAEIAKRGAAKAHPYYQKVFTPDGLKLWGEIKVGDTLFGDDGKPTKVIDIPFDDEADIYKITLKDGRVVYASDEHLWKLDVHCHKNQELWTTAELKERYLRKRKITERNPSGTEYICSIPANKEVDFPHKETKIDPYTFGLLLGDGCFTHPACYFTSKDEDFAIVSKHIPYDIAKWAGKYAYGIHIPKWRNILKEYGLIDHKSKDKFIPDEYKYNSKEVRKALLMGLMDSDGYLGKHEVYSISTVSKRLADDIRELCFSLGYNSTVVRQKAGYKKDGKYIECSPAFIISIFTCDRIANIPRRIRKNGWSCNYAKSRAIHTTITNVEYIGKQKAKCVTVDNTSHCYLVGDYVVTHNSYVLAAKLSKTLILGNRPLKPEEIATKKPQNAKAGLVAYDKQYLTKTDGTLNKFEQDIDFCAVHTEFPRKRLQSSLHDMAWEMGYIDLNTGAKVGTRNAVVGVSVGDDIDKIRGKRQEFIGFEEFGKFPNLSDAYNVSLKSVKEGNRWFGMIALVGTGGEEGADFSGALDMIYHPTGFFMRAYQNVWDKSTQTKGYSIFFFPAYVNRAGCYNKDGISDVTKALFAICCDRYIAKYHNPDPMQLTRTKAEDPVTIQDAIMRRDGSKFPAAQITERIVEIDLNPNFYDTMYVGTLTQNSRGEVEFRPTAESPIRKFPHKDNKIIGAFEISALPQRNKEGKVYNNRYIASCDPVDDDESNTMSLVSFFVLDLWTDSIVCEWTGRDSSAEACYERVRLGCIFYNATLCYENDKKGLFSYFKMMNCLYLLAPTPEYLKDKENIGSEPLNNKYYGVKATAGVNAYARDRLKDWMLIPTTIVKTIDGTEQEVTVPKIMTVWNRAFLEEARQWNPDGNFDRISSMGMLMLLREERLVKFGSLDSLRQERDSKSYKGNDSFFERNYRPKRKK